MSDAAAIGEALRAARERTGLDVDQAAERLHVDAAVIRALEEGRFSALGAPVFVRGHLRRYAELLGEPEAPLQARYAALQEASIAPDLTQLPSRAAPVVQRPARRWPLVLLATVLVLGVAIWWALRASPA
ncbi:MAG TPA: helix-turn-helix domain-containing protein [Steroidobacteraceae bacterium]|nr:helix-turn-helix domain-containing protein [Steroidobacteraceae bacterium]